MTEKKILRTETFDNADGHSVRIDYLRDGHIGTVRQPDGLVQTKKFDQAGNFVFGIEQRPNHLTRLVQVISGREQETKLPPSARLDVLSL